MLALASLARAEDRRPQWTGVYLGAFGSDAVNGEWVGDPTYDPGTGPVPGVFNANQKITGDGFFGGVYAGGNWQTISCSASRATPALAS